MKGCLGLTAFIVAIVMLAFVAFGCSDGTPSHTTIDSTKIETPKPIDTTRQGLFQAVNEAVSRISYVIGNATPVQMKEGDNSDLLQSLIDEKYGTFQIPNGRFLITKTLKFAGSNIVLIGSGNTIIDVEPGIDGVEIAGGGPTIARIKFSSAPIGNGTGIKVHGVAKLIEVEVHGFGGKGISVTADVESAHTNASHTQILFCSASECGDDGLYFQGGDANACDVIGFDSRDNKGWGINDQSFLGNIFINPMAHSNAKGHFKVGTNDGSNDNQRSTFLFFGNYGEEDSPPSEFGGVSMVFGGLLGYEVTADKTFYKGTNTPYRGSGGYIITSPYAKVDTK